MVILHVHVTTTYTVLVGCHTTEPWVIELYLSHIIPQGLQTEIICLTLNIIPNKKHTFATMLSGFGLNLKGSFSAPYMIKIKKCSHWFRRDSQLLVGK